MKLNMSHSIRANPKLKMQN